MNWNAVCPLLPSAWVTSLIEMSDAPGGNPGCWRSNAGAGSMKSTVPGSGPVTVPGLQANLTLSNPPTTALMMMPPISAFAATLSGVRVSSRNRIWLPSGPLAVQV